MDQVATGKYRIENSPFFVKGISFEDIVAGIDDDENLLFDRVLIRGGHSTYRIIRRNGIGEADFSQRWKPIQDAGCSFESADFGYSLYTVDVPPTADASAVYELLELGESNDIWSFEEGHFGGLASE